MLRIQKKEIAAILYKKLSSKSSKNYKNLDDKKPNTTSSLEVEVSKYKMVKKKEIIDFFDSDYKEFKNFIDENEIDIKSFEGLIEALEFKK